MRPERHITFTFLHVSLIFMYLSPGRPQGVLKGIFEQHDFGGDHGHDKVQFSRFRCVTQTKEADFAQRGRSDGGNHGVRM